MLPTAWLLISALRSYKWLFLLFTCHCMPDGRLALATRLTRTRFAEGKRVLLFFMFDSSLNTLFFVH